MLADFILKLSPFADGMWQVVAEVAASQPYVYGSIDKQSRWGREIDRERGREGGRERG